MYFLVLNRLSYELKFFVLEFIVGELVGLLDLKKLFCFLFVLFMFEVLGAFLEKEF